MKEADRIFLPNEYYHIYNRGVDKRNIFSDQEDLVRFFESMDEFNSLSAIGSIYENKFRKKNKRQKHKENNKLVNFLCFCLNPNHYHFIITPVVEKGIEKFMQRLGTGYTMYFNNKHKRTGALFAGKFKSIHIDSDSYLLHLSAYVNLNNLVHKTENNDKQYTKSSWPEYSKDLSNNFCNTDIILEQFKSKNDYIKFAEEALEYIRMKRYDESDESLKNDKILLGDD